MICSDTCCFFQPKMTEDMEAESELFFLFNIYAQGYRFIFWTEWHHQSQARVDLSWVWQTLMFQDLAGDFTLWLTSPPGQTSLHLFWQAACERSLRSGDLEHGLKRSEAALVHLVCLVISLGVANVICTSTAPCQVPDRIFQIVPVRSLLTQSNSTSGPEDHNHLVKNNRLFISSWPSSKQQECKTPFHALLSIQNYSEGLLQKCTS